jgi:hypothetical protein
VRKRADELWGKFVVPASAGNARPPKGVIFRKPSSQYPATARSNTRRYGKLTAGCSQPTASRPYHILAWCSRRAKSEPGLHWLILKKILEHGEPPGYQQQTPRRKQKPEPCFAPR